MTGLISNNDDLGYKEEVQHLTVWCAKNNLALNTRKTKELIVDYNKSNDGTHTPILINGREVKHVTSFKFLGVTLTLNPSTRIKKTQQLLFFLKRLKKVNQSVS